jgi:hypothetical protein
MIKNGSITASGGSKLLASGAGGTLSIESS